MRCVRRSRSHDVVGSARVAPSGGISPGRSIGRPAELLGAPRRATFSKRTSPRSSSGPPPARRGAGRRGPGAHRDVHVSTIERHLEDLRELDVIVDSHLGHEPAIYQLASLARAYVHLRVVRDHDRSARRAARRARQIRQVRLDFTIDPNTSRSSGAAATAADRAHRSPSGRLAPCPDRCVATPGARPRRAPRASPPVDAPAGDLTQRDVDAPDVRWRLA
jgi:hypothetical protein